MSIKLSPRVSLLIIAGLFVLPLAAAWLMYSGTIDYNPVNTRNLGELVQPPAPVPLDSLSPTNPEGPSLETLREHWVLAYLLPAPCDANCIDDVTALRQVHRASGKNQSRIQILLLGAEPGLPGQALLGVYPSFLLAARPEGEFGAQINQVAHEFDAPAERSLYLLDPLGNIMLFYAAGYDANDLKKDLKRLLTWSKLDER
jgi:cytochrome oxidase Cu insertion factor (SCO1/SenC/PrrC family)